LDECCCYFSIFDWRFSIEGMLLFSSFSLQPVFLKAEYHQSKIQNPKSKMF